MMRYLFALFVGMGLFCCLVSGKDEGGEVVDVGGSVSETGWESLFNGEDLSGWVDVNTSETTWKAVDGEMHCTGLPIGVMRSEKMYENFILEIEWKHMKKKGNSGVFLWCDALPRKNRLPSGMEVQMLELDWVNRPNGKKMESSFISGELFAAGDMTATPDNPRESAPNGPRSVSKEYRCKGVGEWNKYTIVAINGTVSLSINGKFVNSIRNSSKKKGYLCLEAEGSEVRFRNIRIQELAGSVITPEEIVSPVIAK